MSDEFGPSQDEMGLTSKDTETEKPVETPTFISEVEPISSSINITIKHRVEIKDLVETPFVTACEELYDKNIMTIESSANASDIKIGYARLQINFDSLSDANKKIAEEITEVSMSHDGMRVAEVKIPIDKENPLVSDIQLKAEEIAHQFKKQRMRWAAPRTLGELKKWYGASYGEDSPEYFVKDEGYYFDEEKGLFYSSEEHYIKAKETVEE